MSNLIALFGRATNDVLEVVPDATAYFFEIGSTTPLIVYTDSGLGTPRGTSVAADSLGIFPQCWTSEALVKIDVRDGTGASLPGFPQDNMPTFLSGNTSAANITFTPVTGNSATELQTAVANNVGRINTLDNGTRLPTSTGSSGTYAITSAYTITAYAVGQEYEFVANQDSVGGGGDTLNVDAVGAVVIKKYSGSTTKADLTANAIHVGDIVRVKYDGTHFVWAGRSVAGMELIEVQDASADATLDFTGFDDSTFGAYFFEIEGLVPDTDNVRLLFRTSSDGGSSFDSGASDYSYYYIYTDHTNGTPAPIERSFAATSDVEIASGVGSDANEDGVSASLRLLGAGQTKKTTLLWAGIYQDTTGNVSNLEGSGVRLASAAVNAVRFLFSGGNVETGRVAMYGLRKV